MFLGFNKNMDSVDESMLYTGDVSKTTVNSILVEYGDFDFDCTPEEQSRDKNSLARLNRTRN